MNPHHESPRAKALHRSLILFLLLGTIIYQFSARGHVIIVDGISWRLPLLIIFNAVYVVIWSLRRHLVAFIFSLLVSSVVTVSEVTFSARREHT
jgi:hypothetical protein